MGQHGLINWADDDEECYTLSLTLIEKAARYLAEHDKGAKTFGGASFESLPETERRATLAQLLPWLRGKVSQQRRFVGTARRGGRFDRHHLVYHRRRQRGHKRSE